MSGLDLKIGDNIKIRNGRLRIGSHEFTSYHLTKELRPGANGRVFKGAHIDYGPCAL